MENSQFQAFARIQFCEYRKRNNFGRRKFRDKISRIRVYDNPFAWLAHITFYWSIGVKNVTLVASGD